MTTLRKGSTGEEVFYLQKILSKLGYFIWLDGVFGIQTHQAVCMFQTGSKLKVDGIVGSKTWDALHNILLIDSNNEIPLPKTASYFLTASFEKAAQALNVSIATIRAVHYVEAGASCGFLPDGRPIILFEGHIFWNQLKKLGIDPESYRSTNMDILFPEWNKASYLGGVAEYGRLNQATVIHHGAALRSAAWGMFQIMGFNHTLCGYDSVFVYAAAMQLNQNYHLEAFVRFLQNTKMDIPLREHHWADFARLYNGPRYKENRYDERLEAAYLQYSNELLLCN